MPKKGIVKCKECDEEFEGRLPDNKEIGRKYDSTSGDFDDEVLVELLRIHHTDTSGVFSLTGGLLGHKYFDVFLKDGSRGEIEANSYVVEYIELGKKGKER